MGIIDNVESMNIGILGGTFDPIHSGHLIIAGDALVRLELAEVIFVPTGQPWLKADRDISPALDRVEMTRLAIASNPHFRLSTVEIERAGSSYAVDTIAALKAQSSVGTSLFFILGWDALAELPLWKEPSQLVGMCKLVAIPRHGCPAPDLKALEDAVPGCSRSIILFEGPYIDIDSTRIRHQVAKGQSIRHLVPEPVERYIREQGLYIA